MSKSKSRNYCAVDGCNSQKTNEELSFFKLPKDEQKRKKWLEIINRPDLLTSQTKSTSHFICSLHFHKSMITKIPHLKADAVPTKSPQNQPSTADHNTNGDFKKHVSTQTRESFTNLISAVSNKSPDTTSLSSRAAICRKKRKIKANASEEFSSSGNRAPVKTEPQSEAAIQVKEECNEDPEPLTLEHNVKIEPVDVKQEIDEDADDGPSGKYVEVTLKNEYDNYIETNENELITNVKVEQEND